MLKKTLDYVLENKSAKFGDDQSILRHRKLGMTKLDRQTDRQTYLQTYRLFIHWLILGPICLKRTQTNI